MLRGPRWAGVHCFAIALGWGPLSVPAAWAASVVEQKLAPEDRIAVNYSVSSNRADNSLFYDLADRQLLLFDFVCKEGGMLVELDPHISELPGVFAEPENNELLNAPTSNPLVEGSFGVATPVPVDLSEAGR